VDFLMRLLWPADRAGAIDNAELERLYSYPDRDWLSVTFVSSVDGAVELGGRAPALSNDPDRTVLALASDLSDALLVGSSTAVVEKFRGQHPDDNTAARRRRHGLSEVAPTVVVSTGSLPPDAEVITRALVPTIVVTSALAARDHGAAWAGAGADVLVSGERSVNLAEALRRLRERGLRRIDCEGGHGLFAGLLAEGLVDELRLTLSPLLVAGDSARIASGPALPTPTRLRLESLVTAEDVLLLRYLTDRS
jgi:riboflavin biosynthesis pyrimidine reductase